VVTLGNWTWGQAGFAPYLSGTDRVIRPANLSPQTPGVGLCVHDGVAVINLLGIFSLTPFESPFLAADRLVDEARRSTPVIIVDFHAEATSEKVALARYLDGRVTAVLGTHTHVQTSDARVLAARHRGDYRRGHDRTARLRDRKRRAQRDQALPHRDADAPRARHRRREDRRRARGVRRGRPRNFMHGRPRRRGVIPRPS